MLENTQAYFGDAFVKAGRKRSSNPITYALRRRKLHAAMERSDHEEQRGMSLSYIKPQPTEVIFFTLPQCYLLLRVVFIATFLANIGRGRLEDYCEED